MKLSEDEITFLETLDGFESDHTSERNLREKLSERGIGDEKFDAIKRRLFFNDYIGIVYGNITLQKKNFRETDLQG